MEKPEQELRTAVQVLSELTGIPEYRLLRDDRGEYITKAGALQAMEEYASQFKQIAVPLKSESYSESIDHILGHIASGKYSKDQQAGMIRGLINDALKSTQQIAVEPEKSAEDFWAEYSQPNHSGARIVTEANFKQAIREAQRIAEDQETLWLKAQLCIKERLGTYSNDLVSDLARWAVEALREQFTIARKGTISSEPKWIDVTERLPEKGQWALIYCWRGIIQASFWTHYWKMHELSTGGHEFTLDEVTHWMPLPSTPNQEIERLKGTVSSEGELAPHHQKNKDKNNP